MAKCFFCSEEIKPGTGILFVKKTGARRFYCSRKCEKNSEKLGRQARNTKWTKKAKSEKKS